MARKAKAEPLQPGWEEIEVGEFLKRRRPMPLLFDLRLPDDADASLLAATVLTDGERGSDVRILGCEPGPAEAGSGEAGSGEAGSGEAGSGEPSVAQELATLLRCTVHVAPAGSRLSYRHEIWPMTGETWDVLPLDGDTGEPVDWVTVRPADVPADVPTWFTSVRGRLRRGNGLVAMALPEGIAFATRSTYREMAGLAGRLRPSGDRLTTVAVGAERGRFEISRLDGTGALLDGADFATLVAASLDTIHPDVLLALTWPRDAADCTTLATELEHFATKLGRRVWVPAAPGSTVVVSGELAAIDEVGGPARWLAYPTDGAGSTRHATDRDGRLTRVGDVSAAAFPGAGFVSVPRDHLTHLREWYQALTPTPGLFAIDLTVLPDGRLGVVLGDSRPAVAVGPRELHALLREAGWVGEELLLLAQPDPSRYAATVEHCRALVDGLKVDVWLAGAGAQVRVQAGGAVTAHDPDGVDGAWSVVAYGHAPDEVALPAALAVTLADPRTGTPRWVATPTRPTRVVAPAATAPSAPAGVLTPTSIQLGQVRSPGLSGPQGTGAGSPHRVPWLPDAAVVNHRALDLYLWTPLASDQVESWGLPAADLFLLAGADPLRLAERRPTGYLLRLACPEHAAIDLAEHSAQLPAAVRSRVAETGATHLLPLPWLGDLRVTARFDLDGQGGVRSRTDLGAGALAIRFEGAGHGVPGLPNEVVHWPEKGSKPSYLLVPEGRPRQVVHRGYLPLQRHKPELADGHRLVEVKMRRGQAIDVPATLDTLAGVPIVGRLHDFVGLDLLLAEADLGQTMVTKVWRPGPGNRAQLDKATEPMELAAILG